MSLAVILEYTSTRKRHSISISKLVDYMFIINNTVITNNTLQFQGRNTYGLVECSRKRERRSGNPVRCSRAVSRAGNCQQNAAENVFSLSICHIVTRVMVLFNVFQFTGSDEY